ncbi:RsmD family RNA methyltransferase [Ekhidna sp.]|uniref:THUMP-like domain-containing protein n=1 Tax=Ekhidna sp. TaxID=2608089 RepID=UPI0035185534
MNQLDLLLQKDVKEFIRENADSDPKKLILNPPGEFKEYIKEIADQIQSRQKAKNKLADWAEDFDLIMPPALSIEQASSESTCHYKQELIHGKHLIDLTGGMGIDCIALSEKFERTTYVEEQAELCEVFKHNAQTLGKEIEVVNESAESFLSRFDDNTTDTTFYIDPARRDIHKNRVFRIEDCSPNLIEILPLLKTKGHKTLVKFSPILDLQAITSTVNGIQEIHIVSVKNDCKEILLLLDFESRSNVQIIAANLQTNQPNYAFFSGNESNSKVAYGMLNKYLLEPNSSVMKAGAFKRISEDFGLCKLGDNTHLYTSDSQVSSFPGRTFEVIATANKKNISRYADKGKINVITRNYPLNASELKKKWKLKDGGDLFLIGFRDIYGKPQTVIGQKIDRSE